MLPGSADQKSEISELDDTSVASPPLELRRPASGPRATTAVPHSLQSPQDRATGKFFKIFVLFQLSITAILEHSFFQLLNIL